MRAQAIQMMNSYISEVHRRPGADFKAEATFYCEENNFEYRKAKEAYDRDRAFEEQHMAAKSNNGYAKLHQE